MQNDDWNIREGEISVQVSVRPNFSALNFASIRK